MISSDANEYANDASLELAWAKKAYDYAQTHMNLLKVLDSQSVSLRLSKHDQDILEKFQNDFPGFSLDPVKEEELKSEEAKAAWRAYAEHFKHVDEYNFGSLLRINPHKDYTEENTIFVTKIQFLAIEIARNRCGLNKGLNKI